MKSISEDKGNENCLAQEKNLDRVSGIRNFFRVKGKQPQLWVQVFIIAITLIMVSIVLFFGSRAYNEIMRVTTDQFNQQQLILARSAATGIKYFISDLEDDLTSLSRFPVVRKIGHGCLNQLESMYTKFPIKTSIRRIDKNGILRVIYPDEGWRKKLVGKDYSEKDYFQQVKKTRHIAISASEFNETGETRIRIAIPVFIEHGEMIGEFAGVLVASFDLSVLNNYYIYPVVSGKTGYAWMLSNDSVFLAHSEEEFAGKNAFEIRARKNPDISYEAIEQIQRRMMIGDEGVDRYISGWHRKQKVEIEKLIAYTPVHISDYIWSVAVSTPVSEVEEIIYLTKRSGIYVVSLLILVLVAGGLCLLIISYRWSKYLKREVTRQTKILLESERKFRTIIKSSYEVIFSKDPEGRYNTLNLQTAISLGATCIEDVIGKTDYDFLPKEQADALRKIDKKVMESNKKIEVEDVVRDALGEDRIYLFHKWPLYDNEGRIAGISCFALDINERKKAEKKLKEAYDIINMSPVVVFLWKNMEDRPVELVTENVKNLFAYSAEEFISGKVQYIKVVHPDDLSRVACEVKTASNEKDRKEFVHKPYRIITKDGKTKWVDNRTVIRRDANGNITHYQGIIIDITERMQVEVVIKSERDKFKTLLDGLTQTEIGIDVVGTDYKVLFQNQVLTNKFGDLTSKLCYEYYMGFKKPCDFCPMIKAIENNRVEKVELTDVNGRDYEILSAPLPNPDGTMDKVIEVVKDITERREAEEKLKKQQEDYRVIYDGVPNHIWYLDKEGKTIKANKAVAESINKTVEELIGKTAFDLFPKEQAVEFDKTNKKVIDSGKPSLNIIEKYTTAKGETRLVSTDRIPEIGPGGIPRGIIIIAQDITEHKQAENSLKKSEDKFTRLTDNLKLAIYRNTPGEKGRFVETNPAFNELFGYKSTDEVMMLNVSDLYKHHEDRKNINEKLLRKGFIKDEEVNLKKKDGTDLICSVYAIAVRDKDDKVIYYDGIIEDITERKKTEEKLRLLSQSINSSNDGLAMGDINSKITYVNKAFTKMFGYSQEELIGKEIAFIYLDDQIPILEKAIKSTIDGNWTGELIGKRKDGSLIPMEISSSRVIDDKGKVIALLASHRNITERKQIEIALRESEENYRTTFESTGTATVIIEEDKTISLANTEFAKLCGYSKEEIEGNKSWTEFVVKDDLKRMKEYHRLRGIDEKSTPGQYEFGFIDKQGNIKNIFLTIALIPGTKKRVASLLDITEKKRIERKLSQVQKMEAIGTLASGIAHEFNNLLVPMLGFTDLVLSDLPAESELHKDLKQVQIAAERAKDMVTKILAFSRQTEGYQKLINLAFIIDEVLNLLQVTLPATIEIRQNLAPDTDKIIADSTQMHQVLMNLCMNAYQAMPKGGILEISLENIKLDKKLSAKFDDLEPGSYIRLTIRDTGYGMDKKTLERIFDPFFTTKYSGVGTGMGLSVVHGIVKNHNGDIIVQSEPGVGTTFQIYLPTVKSIDEALSKKSIKNKEK